MVPEPASVGFFNMASMIVGLMISRDFHFPTRFSFLHHYSALEAAFCGGVLVSRGYGLHLSPRQVWLVASLAAGQVE